jgi:iron complex outermembrane receptor protein
MIGEKEMKRVITASLLFSLLNAGDDLSALLNIYEKESDLSKQTKVESLGHSTVFTRNDLDRMQFDTLSDMLKYVKLTSFAKSRFGTNGLVQLGASSLFPSSVRLYINDMDLSSVYTDSPFFTYANISLTNIDHAEIYLGSSALKLGDYPSAIVVKLYTKKPDRENNSIIKTKYYSNNSYMLDAFSAKRIDENSDYLILLNRSVKEDKKTIIHNQKVSDNSNQKSAYIKYRYKKSNFEFSYIDLNIDPFMGLSVDSAPDDIYMNSKEYYFMYTYKNNDYKLNLSYANNDRDYIETNKISDGGLLLPIFTRTTTYLNEKRYMNKLNISLSKTFQTKNNSIFTSVSMQNRENDAKRFDYISDDKKYDGKGAIDIKLVRNYSFSAEDNYNISERNLIFSSFKYDIYKGSSRYKDTENYIARVGFITIPNEKLKMKGFLTKSYMPVTIIQQEFAKDELKQINAKSATFETTYNKEKNEFSSLIGYSEVNNLIVFDKDGAKNIDKKINVKYFNLNYKYNINSLNKIDISYSRTIFNKNVSSKESVIAKFVSTINKFDIFTGIVYNPSYTALGVNVNPSFDVDLGMVYHINNVISFKIKGNNIFDNSSKSVYTTPFESGEYENDTQKFSATLEIEF